MPVHIFNNQDSLEIDQAQVETLVAQTLSFLEESYEELSIHFVDIDEITSLHEKYFDDPTPTDCITFPLDDADLEHRVLGDVFVCPEVGIEQAKEENTDPYFEVSLYIMHGILHLIGYKDHTPEMESKQNELVDNAKKNSLLLSKKI